MSETATPPTPTEVLEGRADVLPETAVEAARARIEDYDGWQYGEHSPSVVTAAAVWLETGDEYDQPTVAALFGVSDTSIRNAQRSLGVERDHRRREVEDA